MSRGLKQSCVLRRLLLSSQFQGLDADGEGAPPVPLVLCGHFEKQRVRTLGPVGVRLGRAGAGEGPLDHDVQRDGSRPLRGLGGGARRIEQHRYGLGERVRVRVLMVEVVGVDVLPRRRGRLVRGERGRGGRGRQLIAHWHVAGLVPRVRRGGDVLAGGRRLLRVPLGDGGGPLRRHRWGRLGWHQAGATTRLGEVGWKRRVKFNMHENKTQQKGCV